jgi:hypothetical protein
MNFGQAIELLKQGKLVARNGWNGKGMFIFQRPADNLTVDFIVNKVKSLPQSLKDHYSATRNMEDTIHFNAYLCMKAADNTIVNGWLASQTDMLANDWEEVL